jgi:PAS domain S-box-containing protein
MTHEPGYYRELFYSVVSQAPLGIILVDGSGQAVFLNQKAHQILGQNPRLSQNLDFSSINHPEDLSQDLDQFRALVAGDISEYQMTKRYIKPNGLVVWVDLHVGRVSFDSQGVLALAIIEDITESVQANTLKDQMLSSLKQFSYVAAHDLKEPFRQISNLSGLALMQLDDQEMGELEESLNDIQEIAENAHVLIGSLFEYIKSQRSVSAQSETNLLKVLLHVISLYEGEDFELYMDSKNLNRSVSLDQISLVQIFTNLFSNSIKFRTSDRFLEISISYEEKLDYHSIIFSDNGIGIPSHYSDKIFFMFERVNSEIDGTGMGLSICQGILRQLGGDILLLNPGSDRGSAFEIQIPKLEW